MKQKEEKEDLSLVEMLTAHLHPQTTPVMSGREP